MENIFVCLDHVFDVAHFSYNIPKSDQILHQTQIYVVLKCLVFVDDHSTNEHRFLLKVKENMNEFVC